MQRCRISLFYRLSKQIQQVRSRTWRLSHGFVIVYRYRTYILTIVEPSEGDPDTGSVACKRVQSFANSQFMHKSCGIDAHPDACSYLFVLRGLLVYVDFDGYTGSRAMMVDG